MTHPTTELKYWLALNRTPYIGPVTFKAVLDVTDSPKDIFDNIDDIKKMVNLNARALSYMKNPDWQEIESELQWSEEKNNHIITLNDARYPQLLRQIHDAPPLLYIHGNTDTLNQPQLAIVGSRNPSPSGKECAYQFAKYLAQTPLTITSGLALGIDYESHRGALAAQTLSGEKKQATTLAVIGTGLNRVYPAAHRQLAHEIVNAGGALVSEYPLDTPAKREHFPKRNRIISGMSMGVLVVEAAQQSGSLITARYAGEYGREVFAIPGSIHNPLAKGCHALIRQGAKLVEKAEDILEEITHLYPGFRARAHSQQTAKADLLPLSAVDNSLDEKQLNLLNQLGFEPTHIDTVVQRSGLTPEAVSSMLLVLELQDYVQSLPGGTYTRIK